MFGFLQVPLYCLSSRLKSILAIQPTKLKIMPTFLLDYRGLIPDMVGHFYFLLRHHVQTSYAPPPPPRKAAQTSDSLPESSPNAKFWNKWSLPAWGRM
jgi:hypothetical protein